ncbi:WD40 repeat domain-containing protein [Vairimorpha necatrix]|uniref:WD40 repeat domain-containing protein n=1 Tax=Vairimorpha necatrix TaxID=6039 RepID=A0AAX4JGE0_9MICR
MKTHFTPKKKDLNIINSLNTLIYDYLLKMKFDKTAQVFITEAYIGEKVANELPPALFEWYLAFHEISNIRCGITNNSGDVARIEGIMLKLENEKKRYQHMGRLDGYYGKQEGNDVYGYNAQYYGTSPRMNRTRYEDVNYKVAYGKYSSDESQYSKYSSDDLTYGKFDPQYLTNEEYKSRPHKEYIRNQDITRNDNTRNEEYISKSRDITRNQDFTRKEDYNQEYKDYNQDYNQDYIRNVVRNKDKVKNEYLFKNDDSISPNVFDPLLSNDDFIIKTISSLRLSDREVITSCVSRDHKRLFNVYNNKTIGSFNYVLFKNECIVETNGKQITMMKIKDTPDFIWIVATFDTNELMVIRYLINDLKFEMAGYLRDHKNKISCFDISEYIVSLDIKGNLKRWNFKGQIEKEEKYGEFINSLYIYNESKYILSDSTRTYLYDHNEHKEISEISKGYLLNLKYYDGLFIFVFTDKVLICDKSLNKIKNLLIPDIKGATVVEGKILVVTSQVLWYESPVRLSKCSILDKDEIINIESINNYKAGHFLILTKKGELKILSKS